MIETADNLRLLLLIYVASDEAEDEDQEHRLMQTMKEKRTLCTQEWFKAHDKPESSPVRYYELETIVQDKFCNSFRMSPDVSNILLEKVHPFVEKQDTSPPGYSSQRVPLSYPQIPLTRSQLSNSWRHTSHK